MRLADWKECKACRLHLYRHKVVIGRGSSAPYAILFVGLAPGKTEDLQGKPFVGPSGRILAAAMGLASRRTKIQVPAHYITNLVACIPRDGWQEPIRNPRSDEVFLCQPRLMEIYRQVDPQVVVTLGEVAARECRGLFAPPPVPLIHPAAIVRTGGVESSHFLLLVRGLMTIFEAVGREPCRE